LLKIIKIMKTFTFRFCTLRVLLGRRRQVQAAWRQRKQKEDWMKKVIFLATVAFLAMLVLAPVAMAQSSTMMMSAAGSSAPSVPSSGGPAILLPAAALLLGSGILTYAILRRR
jgi:sterol desaturase/sphingolipid hydroxylase (fatty acid hydroxylase superfamily)